MITSRYMSRCVACCGPHRTENPRVGGSSPPLATIESLRENGGFRRFGGWRLAGLIRGLRHFCATSWPPSTAAHDTFSARRLKPTRGGAILARTLAGLFTSCCNQSRMLPHTRGFPIPVALRRGPN